MTVAAIARQVASALGRRARQGHRPPRPQAREHLPRRSTPADARGERVKILDFGIAKLAVDGLQAPRCNTRTGSMMGTPLYMSPEQCRGAGAVDHRADIYALGCILFELLTGRCVFQHDAPGDLLVAHISERPPSLASLVPGVPIEIDQLVNAMLAKSPNDRPQSMDVAVAVFERLLGVAAADFIRIVPVTSQMIPIPPMRRSMGPTRAMAAVTGGGDVASVPVRLPDQPSGRAGSAGGTQMLIERPSPSPRDSTFRRTASELVTDAAPPRSKTPLFAAAGTAAAIAIAVVVYFSTSGPRPAQPLPPATNTGGSPAAEVAPPLPPPPPPLPPAVERPPAPVANSNPLPVKKVKGATAVADRGAAPAEEGRRRHETSGQDQDRRTEAKSSGGYFPVGD